MEQMIEVAIDSVRVSLMSPQRLVVLREMERERFLPIWVGPYEAEAITVALQEVEMVRPLTHDLLVSVVQAMSSRVSRVVVTHVTDGTFYARLYLEASDGRETEVDSRTSDAIAVAVRTGSTIYVDERVLDEAGVEPEREEQSAEDEEKLTVFREFINSLDIDLEGGEKGPPTEEQGS